MWEYKKYSGIENTQMDHFINSYWSGSHFSVFLDHSGYLSPPCTTSQSPLYEFLKSEQHLGMFIPSAQGEFANDQLQYSVLP